MIKRLFNQEYTSNGKLVRYHLSMTNMRKGIAIYNGNSNHDWMMLYLQMIVSEINHDYKNLTNCVKNGKTMVMMTR